MLSAALSSGKSALTSKYVIFEHFFTSTGVLTNSAEDFEDSAEIFDAIGEVLQEVANEKSEDDIKDICDKLWGIMRPNSNSVKKENRVLDAPVHLKSMTNHVEEDLNEIKSIWVTTRDDQLVSILKLLIKSKK